MVVPLGVCRALRRALEDGPRIVRLVAVLACVPHLGGCLGGTVVRQATTTDDSNIALENERGYISKAQRDIEYKKEDVLQLWGPPYARDTDGQNERWKYHRETAFSGLFLEIILPVPLVVPVGYRDTTLIFSDDVLVKVVREYGGSTGFVCAVVQDLIESSPGRFPHPICKSVLPRRPTEWK